MNKYIIEGGIDFYEELYKSLDIEETNEKTEEDNNLCLITNQPLVDKFVNLNCGHKFNYVALFLDLKNHKQKFNGMEGSNKLSIHEIRCPYCRTKQQGVLPYYEELGFPKINGVNDINLLTTVNKNSYSYKPCEFILENNLYDPSGDNPVEYNTIACVGNCKFIKCFLTGTQINTVNGKNIGDEKHYCWIHKKIIIQKHKKEIKDKQKLDIKKAKEVEKQKAKDEAKKAKDEAKKAKEEAKEKAKKEKEDTKKTKKKPNIETENVVIGETNIIEVKGNTGCIEILKSGQNKGKPCGCKIILDELCNRHFKIKNGITQNNI
jgi:hypothetical protein